MPFPRIAGAILHPTSLPGGNGVGDLGKEAYLFIDALEKASIGLWQVLPLGPINESNSPYQSISTYAGNSLLIALEPLIEERLISEQDLKDSPENSDQIKYSQVKEFKEKILRKAGKEFANEKCSIKFLKEYLQFCEQEKKWLDDFALFVAAKKYFNEKPWYLWDDNSLKNRKQEAIEEYTAKFEEEIKFQKLCQFLFFNQWRKLREYAKSKNIQIVGDLPIYCAHDSVDVWTAKEYFLLENDGSASFMAGVPPDYYAATGQLWGNPLYNWKKLEETNYKWWINRIKAVLALVDILRIDHFRGFQAYWEVPKGEKTAINGKWKKGPGQKFFDEMKKELGDNLPIIAEDLGVITPEVEKIRLDNNIPGMKVLQFAFSEGAEVYLPHNYEKNCVCYVATHDNDTTKSWYEAYGSDYEHMDRNIIEQERDKARRYLGRDGSDITWNLMRLALQSVADIAVILAQDIFNLGNNARMNRPGVADKQWAWRMTREQLENMPVGSISDMIWLYERNPLKKNKENIPDVETED